ncbi:hypothetical protein J4211_04010, partial [Candidatus Woesearchaeota archaeon]|nr:hypothetical protein [Candidatus Woesearchaeota archaeon]
TKSRNYRVFIQVYEWACKILGISETNRAITYAQLERWKKQMTDFYKTHRTVEIDRAGFVPK